MTIRTYNMRLDVKSQATIEQVVTRQGDATGATRINVSLVDGGAPVGFTGAPEFRAITPISKLVVVDSGNFSNVNPAAGKFTYDIPSQVLAEPGKMAVAYFAIKTAAGVDTTLAFTVFIEQAADLNPAHYGDYISTVDGAIDATKADIDDLNRRIDEAQTEWAAGDFVSINTEQTISGAKTFTAPINGALATRVATFTDFADVASHMDTYAGNWYVKNTAIANPPAANMLWYVVDVIPGNNGTVGVIRISQYGKNAYFAIPNNGVLGTWHRVATDTDVAAINSSIDAVKQSVAVTGWTNAGLTYLNGATKNAVELKYRTAKFAGMHMVQFAGWINFPAFPSSGTLDAVAAPASLFTSKLSNNLGAVGLSGSKIVSMYVTYENGHLSLVNNGQMTTGGSIEINLTITF